MKTYKLIKEYPGSPKLNSKIFYWNGGWRTHKTSLQSIIGHPVDYPKYWEEIIEKDYEILSYIDENTKTICNIVNGKFLQSEIIGPYFTIEDAEDEIDFNIYSVKRLSDGEIFSVGDKILNTNGQTYYLNRFETTGNKIRLWLCYFKNKEETQGLLLSLAKHIKKPLFTTEDGVDIYKGDNYCKVTSNFLLSTDWKASNSISFTNHMPGAKFFSTKEKAKEYILMNKPCLSINEIIYITTTAWCNNENMKILKELVKNKL